MTSSSAGPTARRRLDPDERLRQILEAAGDVFAHVPYDRAQVDQIAEKIGASTSLIYHYFPTKRALFAAVVDQAIEDLGRMTDMPEGVPMLERLSSGISGYLDYIETYEHAYRAMHRGRESGDARVQAAIERNTRRQIERVVHVLAPDGGTTPELELAIRGALGMVITICLDWLEHRQVDREHLRSLLVGSTLAAVAGAMDPARTQEVAAALLVPPEGQASARN